MILVDTSVLIGYFKGIQNHATNKLQFIFYSGIPFGINSLIYQELLQGTKTEKEFNELKAYLETQVFYDLKDKKKFFCKGCGDLFQMQKKRASGWQYH